MKKSITIIVALFINALTFAQAPQKMTYQAVVRNASNVLIQNSSVGMKISILKGSVTGTAVYVETHNAQTNQNGLLDIVIGAGTVVFGNYSDSIIWREGPFFLKTEIDPNGGSNYSITSTSEMLSVPYSNYAHLAGTVDSKSGVANPGWGAWGNITIPHNKNKRPKKVTLKYVTKLVSSSQAWVANIICESEWRDEDRDGLGNLFYQVVPNSFAIIADSTNILSNTNILGRICIEDYQSGQYVTMLLQELSIISNLNGINILAAQPNPVNLFNNSIYTIVGPWKMFYDIEW